MWNKINSIHSIWTYIINTINLVLTCLLIHHSFIFFGYLRSLSKLISTGEWLTVTRLAEITWAGFITFSAISFPVAGFISPKKSFTSCPSFNLKAFERELLYEIWPYRGSFMICPCGYNCVYSSSNSSCVKLHLYIAIRQYGSFREHFVSMKAISSSQCLTSGYEAWNWLLDVWSLLPFRIRQITTMEVVFGNSGRWPVALLPTRSPKFVASRLLPRLPFFLASRTSLAHFFKNISTHCCRIHSALSKFSKGSHVSKVSKNSATTVSQCRGPSRICFKRFCPRIMHQCFFSKNPATHTFFHLLNVLKLGYHILLANCFKENPVCIKVMEAWPLAPPKSDKSSLSTSASNSS